MANLAKIEAFVAQNEAVLLYFKNDACGPCRVLRPKVEALLQADFPKVKMMIVDSEQQPLLNGHYGVFSNPTLLVFFDGKEYLRKSKHISMGELKGEMQRLYQLAFDE